MFSMQSLSLLLSVATPLVAAAGLSDSSLVKHVNSLALSSSFNPVEASYWTGLPHHRRTPFAVSPDGKSAYLAYLDSSATGVHIQQVNPTDFTAVGTAVTVAGGKEAGGLVAHNDGFALLTNEALPSGTANAPADNTPVPVLYKYTNGKQAFKTFLGGPGVHPDDGLSASPDLNGDLVYSEAAGLYGAYFVVTDYSGWAEGHFGDSVQYVSENGTLETLPESSTWGCSHNTGIAFEAADAVPFASICAEDQGAIWLNTKDRGMSLADVKISNENTTNGAGGEAMGGMGGSYSGLARYQDKDSYIFAWVSRGSVDLTANTWMGDGYTATSNRTNGRNVAIAQFSDKNTLIGEQATSKVGAADGDSQINWITTGTADCSNAHVATFDGASALVTWEEIANPQCDFIAMGCAGAFSGSYFQLVTDGAKVGEPIKSTDTYVAGDMVTMADGRICWPYVDMTWTLDAAITNAPTTKQISFACVSNGVSAKSAPAATPAASSAASPAAATSQVSTGGLVKATSAAPVVATSSAAASSVVDPVEATTPAAASTSSIGPVVIVATSSPEAAESTSAVATTLSSSASFVLPSTFSTHVRHHTRTHNRPHASHTGSHHSAVPTSVEVNARTAVTTASPADAQDACNVIYVEA